MSSAGAVQDGAGQGSELLPDVADRQVELLGMRDEVAADDFVGAPRRIKGHGHLGNDAVLLDQVQQQCQTQPHRPQLVEAFPELP